MASTTRHPESRRREDQAFSSGGGSAGRGKPFCVGGRDSLSYVVGSTGGGFAVHMTTLDEEFRNQRIDILKIDVEGLEEKVFQGSIRLLKDPARCPRLMYIEVHPYAWGAT